MLYNLTNWVTKREQLSKTKQNLMVSHTMNITYKITLTFAFLYSYV